MNTKNIITIASVLLCYGCAQVDEVGESENSQLRMDISVGIENPAAIGAGMSTEKLSHFGLFVVNKNNLKSSYDNVMMVKNANGAFEGWNANQTSPIILYWQNLRTSVEMMAYAPYGCSDTGICSISVAEDQRTAAAIEHSDFVYMKQVINPTQDRDSNGKVALRMAHQLAKLKLRVSLSGAIYQQTDQDPISELSIAGTCVYSEFSIDGGELKNVHTKKSISPYFTSFQMGDNQIPTVADYEAILIPQTSQFQINLTAYGVAYTYIVPSEVTLNKDTQYTLSVTVGKSGVIATEMTQLPWGDGGDEVLIPDLTKRVMLNPATSTIPVTAKLEVDKRLLHLSYRGGSGVLAFDGEFDKNLTVTSSDSRLTFGTRDELYKYKHLTFKAEQPEEGEAYSVTFKLTNALLTHDKGYEMTIRVDANRLPTVRMGGLEWMAYNGRGKEISLYHKLEVDQTVRDVYREHWADYTAMCVWGLRSSSSPMLYPWTVILATNLSGNLLDATKWDEQSGNIPCPAGWRLPTLNELRSIWPPNQAPAATTYVEGGVTYTTRIEPSGAPAIQASNNESIATNLFVLSDGKGELLFPMAGWRCWIKWVDNKVETIAKDAGKAFYLWTSTGGNRNWSAYVLGLNSENKVYDVPDANLEPAATDGYQMVRCVRTITN